MALAKAIGFWMIASTLGLGVWLLIGFIFGRHARTIREQIARGLRVAADEIADIGRGWVEWGKERFRDLARLGERAMDRIAPADRPDHDTPPNPQLPQGDDDEVNVTLVVIASFILLIFVGGNGYLLYDVFPDLIELTPAQLKSGMTKYVAFLLPGDDPPR